VCIYIYIYIDISLETIIYKKKHREKNKKKKHCTKGDTSTFFKRRLFFFSQTNAPPHTRTHTNHPLLLRPMEKNEKIRGKKKKEMKSGQKREKANNYISSLLPSFSTLFFRIPSPLTFLRLSPLPSRTPFGCVVWGGVIGFAHILTKALFGGGEEEERKKNLPFPSQLTGRLVQCFFAILCYLFFFPSLVALRSSFLCFFPHPLLCFFLFFFFWFQKK